MIFVTGDVHCPIDIHKLTTKAWPAQRQLTKQDYLIVCGDFGIVWDNSNTDKYWQKWFDNKPFTTLFVDGNHSNHHLLNEFETVNLFGGKAHKINNSVYHLMRGEIFIIEDKKFLALGGAPSHDKELRTPGLDWWPEEVPNNKECLNAINNLQRNNNEVDYIITHDIPTYVGLLRNRWFEPNAFTNFLSDEILNAVKFKKWFAGHYHIDDDLCFHKMEGNNKVIPMGLMIEYGDYISEFHILYDRVLELN
jgi:hypothetical protein